MADEPSAKWGAGALAAHGRQGLGELRAALPLADSNIAQHTDLGMPGMATPGEVSEARQAETPAMDGDDSVVASRLNQVGPAREPPGKEDRDMDRE
jgi:hypothetical protein